MSLQSKNRGSWLFFITALYMLSGCGFHPMYAQKTSDKDVSQVFAGVKVDYMPGRSGQLLKSNLEDRLNPDGSIPANPVYRLRVTMRNSVVPIGVARDGTVSRYNVYLTSKYVLYHIADDKPVTSGDIGYVDSYNNLVNEYYSTYASEEDAFKNGIIQLSELYRERLSAYLSEGAPVQPVKDPDAKENQPTGPLNPLIFNPEPSQRTPYQ